MTQEPEANPAARKRTRKTRPYPVHTLEDALTISAAIYDENAARPYERIRLAKALGTTPTSSGFMQKLNYQHGGPGRVHGRSFDTGLGLI